MHAKDPGAINDHVYDMCRYRREKRYKVMIQHIPASSTRRAAGDLAVSGLFLITSETRTFDIVSFMSWDRGGVRANGLVD